MPNKKTINTYNLGVDIGSTTMKVAIIDDNNNLIFSDYRRHNVNIRHTARTIIGAMYNQLGTCRLRVMITGSVGMGYAERLGFNFAQEVVAAALKHTAGGCRHRAAQNGEFSPRDKEHPGAYPRQV
mgnify:CR=1 FL=1